MPRIFSKKRKLKNVLKTYSSSVCLFDHFSHYFLLFSFRSFSSGSRSVSFLFRSAVVSIVLPRFLLESEAARLISDLLLESTESFFRSRSDFCVRGENMERPVELRAAMVPVALLFDANLRAVY